MCNFSLLWFENDTLQRWCFLGFASRCQQEIIARLRLCTPSTTSSTPCTHNHIYGDGRSHSRYHLNRNHILRFSAASLRPSFFEMKAVALASQDLWWCFLSKQRGEEPAFVKELGCTQSVPCLFPFRPHNSAAEPARQ